MVLYQVKNVAAMKVVQKVVGFMWTVCLIAFSFNVGLN